MPPERKLFTKQSIMPLYCPVLSPMRSMQAWLSHTHGQPPLHKPLLRSSDGHVRVSPAQPTQSALEGCVSVRVTSQAMSICACSSAAKGEGYILGLVWYVCMQHLMHTPFF